MKTVAKSDEVACRANDAVKFEARGWNSQVSERCSHMLSTLIATRAASVRFVLVLAATLLIGLLALPSPAYSMGSVVVTERIVIVGKKPTLTADEELALENELLILEVGQLASLNMLIEVLPLDEIARVTAFTSCSSDPRISQTSRATTSHEIEALRWRAATNIIDATVGTRNIGLNGKVVTVVYSDGGSEKFVYCTMCSTHGAVPASLVLGNGVAGSACQQPS